MPIRAAFDQGQAPLIAFVNQATITMGVDFDALIAACQRYVNECFSPVWGTPATLVRADKLSPGQWGMVFLDDADAAGALGYHDMTWSADVAGARMKYPLSKVFVRTTLDAGEKVSVTTSHELAEMLVDPAINMWATGPRGALWAYEMCDAVETEEFEIDGIAMSDFVYPAFFEKFRVAGSARFDYLNRVTKPFQILPGGYGIVATMGRESQVFGRGGRDLPVEIRANGLVNVFGSQEKAEAFAKENREGHRSEYREAPDTDDEE
jgi:hypothetical protein